MFERFTEKAIKVIMLAQEEARRLGFNDVGVEVIFLGLIGEGTSIGAKALKRQCVNLKTAREVVESKIGRGTASPAIEMPFTPEASSALKSAWNKSKQLECNFIGPQHLLLGLIDSIPKILEAQAVNAEQLKADISALTAEIENLGLIRSMESFALAGALRTTIRELEMNIDVETFEKILKSEAFKKLVKKGVK